MMSASRTISNEGHSPGIEDWHNTGGLSERVTRLDVILKATVPG
jgi:hypothetical protein